MISVPKTSRASSRPPVTLARPTRVASRRPLDDFRSTSVRGTFSVKSAPLPSRPRGAAAPRKAPLEVPALPAEVLVQAGAAPYPTSIIALLGRHAVDGIDALTVFAAARVVLARDDRFSPSARRTLRAPLAEQISRAGSRARLAALPPKVRKRLIKVVTDDLVGLTPRPTVAASPFGPNGPRLLQTAGHLVQKEVGGRTIYEVAHGLTLSSEAAKRDHQPTNRHLCEHLAQAFAVTLGHRLVAFRSARADTPAKMRAKLTQAAIAALEAAGGDPTRATGWRRVGGAWRFTPTLVTAMDRSRLKHLVASVLWLFGGERPERFRLGDLAASADALFRDGRSLGITVAAAGGAPVAVTLMPPRLLNVVLSGRSSSPGNLQRTRRANGPAMLRLAQDLSRAWRTSADPLRRAAAAALSGGGGPEGARRRLAGLLTSDLFRSLDTRARLALEALGLGLLGRTSGGDSLERASDPGHELLLDQALIAESGGAYLVECKSGIDRTGTAVGLAAATAAMDARRSPFDPLVDSGRGAEMRRLFTLFADAFGADVVKLTRSTRGGIKWRGKATSLAWYAPEAVANSPLGPFI